MQNSRSKQAVGYSKESHLYSDVTAPSPAKISVNAFSPSRFSVQTRCLVQQTRPTRARGESKGTKAQPSQNALINKLGKDISQCLIPVTVHIPDSSPRAKRVVDDDPSSLLKVLRLIKPGDPVVVRFILRVVRDISVFIALASNPRLTTQIFFP